MEGINKFLGDWQYIWFFVILLAGLLVEFHSNFMLRKEFDYDKEKDDRRKRTKTTKKTTKGKEGGETTEETTEISEPMVERNVEGDNVRDQ
jgi:hypothetical protein